MTWALVTGAGQRLGRAVALELARAGWGVAVHYRNSAAEAQAAEEMRRRDPVKRAMWLAALLIAMMLVWASSLQLKAIVANKDLGAVVAQMNLCTNEYKTVVEMQKKVADMSQKLTALNELSTNRFLNGTLLNALQQTTVEDVQLVHLKLDQTYLYTEGSKAKQADVDKIARDAKSAWWKKNKKRYLGEGRR